MRWLLNVMYSGCSELQPEIIVPLDTEKAFDRIEWGYLLIALEKFGFGPAFLDWLKILHSNPMSSVCTSGTTSFYFALHRGKWRTTFTERDL